MNSSKWTAVYSFEYESLRTSNQRKIGCDEGVNCEGKLLLTCDFLSQSYIIYYHIFIVYVDLNY